MAEVDERYKRRKVSQALYGQKGKELLSVEHKPGRYVWGLPSWYQSSEQMYEGDRAPILDEDDE